MSLVRFPVAPPKKPLTSARGFFSAIHPHIGLFLHVVATTFRLRPQKSIGSLGKQKSSRYFSVTATGIHGIDPHKRLFLWRNCGFTSIHPHIRPFLWRNLCFCATHPHKGLFLWTNLCFSATYPHIRPFLWRNLCFFFRNSSTYWAVFACSCHYFQVEATEKHREPRQTKSSRFFSVTATGIHGIDPRTDPLLWIEFS